jgi:hypothetical protein
LQVNDRHLASVSGTADHEKALALKKSRYIERSRHENPRCVSDDEDIVFEDFARLRRSETE